jgi:hypothetical protein
MFLSFFFFNFYTTSNGSIRSTWAPTGTVLLEISHSTSRTVLLWLEVTLITGGCTAWEKDGMLPPPLQKRHKNSQQVYEKVHNITYQGRANHDIASHLLERLFWKRQEACMLFHVSSRVQRLRGSGLVTNKQSWCRPEHWSTANKYI